MDLEKNAKPPTSEMNLLDPAFMTFEKYTNMLTCLPTRLPLHASSQPIGQLNSNDLAALSQSSAVPLEDILWILKVDSVLLFKKMKAKNLLHFMRLAVERGGVRYDTIGLEFWNRAKEKWMEKRLRKCRKQNSDESELGNEDFFENCEKHWCQMLFSKRVELLNAELPEDLRENFWKEPEETGNRKEIRIFKTLNENGLRKLSNLKTEGTQTEVREYKQTAVQTKRDSICNAQVQTDSQVLPQKSARLPRRISPFNIYRLDELRKRGTTVKDEMTSFLLRQTFDVLDQSEKEKYETLSQGTGFRRLRVAMEWRTCKSFREAIRMVRESLFLCYVHEVFDRLQEKHQDLEFLDVVKKAYKRFKKFSAEQLRELEEKREKLIVSLEKMKREAWLEKRHETRWRGIQFYYGRKVRKKRPVTEMDLEEEMPRKRSKMDKHGPYSRSKDGLPASLAMLLPEKSAALLYVNDRRREGNCENVLILRNRFCALPRVEKMIYEQELRTLRLNFAQACKDYLAGMEKDEEREKLESFLKSLKGTYCPDLLEEIVDSDIE